MKLIICGNGMDLHLGFRTSYPEYRNFLGKVKFIQGESAISIVENSQFFASRDAECWSNLEESLTFDIQKYISEMLFAYDRDLQPFDEKKSREQIKAASEFERYNPEKIAFDFTNTWFLEWIGREFYNNVERVKTNYYGILKNLFSDANCLFVNFNYTPSLEFVFGIEEERILYIHNRFPAKPVLPFSSEDLLNDIIESGKKKFQFGSTNNKLEEWLEALNQVSLQSQGKLISKTSIEDKVRSIYRSFSKNLEDNYNSLEDFLQSQRIEEVVVVGHSFMGVDEPYYRDILVPLLKDCKWTFFCHGSRNAAQEFIRKYNISKKQMIDW